MIISNQVFYVGLFMKKEVDIKANNKNRKKPALKNDRKPLILKIREINKDN